MEETKAVAHLTTPLGEPLGTVHFFANPLEEYVQVDVKLAHVRPPGLHGMHVHEKGLGVNGQVLECEAMGPHFNPTQEDHGGTFRSDRNPHRHLGDLGNVVASDNGLVRQKFLVEDISLDPQHPFSIIGRGLVIHLHKDDLGQGTHSDSKTTGHSGPRIACGVITAL